MASTRRFASLCSLIPFFVLLLLLPGNQAFLPPLRVSTPSCSSSSIARCVEAAGFQQQQHLVTRTRQQANLPWQSRGRPLYGIFGLGTPELVIIALVAGIVLGPDKIVDLARGVGKAAGELKAVPQEFEKGLKTGEEAALKTKAELAKKKEDAEKKEE